MKINDYIEKCKPELINGILFFLTDVNYDDELDINEKTSYEETEYSFIERLQKAKEEIKEEIKGMTNIKDVFNHYKKETEEGNSNYWGVWYSVQTYEYTPSYIMYGVRMD